MSYSALAALGTVDPWQYMSAHLWSTADVYVLRLAVKHAPLTDPTDALLFVRAAGQGQNLRMDVRGVAVLTQPASKEDEATVDIVMSISDTGLTMFGWQIPGFSVPFVADDAASMARQVAKDEALRARFPGFEITSSVFGQLTAPPQALDHWRAQPLLWDHSFTGAKMRGGPTDTFATPATYSIVRGKADDGAQAVPWKIGVPPIGPNGNGKKPGGGDNTVWWIVGLGVLGLVGLKAVKKET